MRSTITVILAMTGLILTTAAVLNARDQPVQERLMQFGMSDSTGVNRHVSMLAGSLNLTAEQTQKIRAILTDEQRQLAADRDKYRADTGSFEKTRDRLRKKTDRQIMEMLNRDQQRKFSRLVGDNYKSGRIQADHGTAPAKESQSY
jgi:Spy/CpxP family protein refolding chaperone